MISGTATAARGGAGRRALHGACDARVRLMRRPGVGIPHWQSAIVGGAGVGSVTA
jgi:hypothetical protein